MENKMKEAIRIIDYEDLTKKGLITLIKNYDNYIQEAVCLDSIIDYTPVCAHEYLNNDIRDIIMGTDALCDNGCTCEDYSTEVDNILETLNTESKFFREELIEILKTHDGYNE